MKITIFDTHFKVIDELEGSFNNNVFTYQEGGFVIPILKWRIGAKNIKIPIDYEKTIDIGNEHKAYLQYDGKDYKQIYFDGQKDVSQPIDESTFDLINELEKGELYEDAMIEKPFGIREIIGILLVIALGLAILLNYWTGKDLAATWHAQTQPFNQSVQQTGQLMKVVLNYSLQNHNLYLACLNKTTGG